MWTIGSGGVAAIFALLVVFHNQRVAQWKAGVQLSTMIAALSQVAQSALLASISACIGQLKWSWLKELKGHRPGDLAKAIDILRIDEATRGPKGSLQLLLNMRRP